MRFASVAGEPDRPPVLLQLLPRVFGLAPSVERGGIEGAVNIPDWKTE